ncbi:MAG: transketolase C-terminal domain-containing protein [Candidatus Hodarchaeota archaeon]
MTSKETIMEGSHAIAYAVKACQPHVVSAYPITPQTHIVERISDLVADGEMKTKGKDGKERPCRYVRVESEFSAASVVAGASATGARTYSATTSQGLILMSEVLFNIAGMRLPVVITCANRGLSAPITIWNDHQDSVSQRDNGWIQMYGEHIQEIVDMHIQAFKIAEELKIPAMICLDGFILTHVYEPVELPDEEKVRKFLPDYKPEFYLDPQKPRTFGAFAAPNKYMETRYILDRDLQNAKKRIDEVANEFKNEFGRYFGGLIEEYRTEDAEIMLLAMGSVVGTMKDAIDNMREQGKKVGLIKLRVYRPFPKESLVKAMSKAKVVGILDKNISLGNEGAVFTEVKSALYDQKSRPKALNFIVGLGQRDITTKTIENIVANCEKALTEEVDPIQWMDLIEELI